MRTVLLPEEKDQAGLALRRPGERDLVEAAHRVPGTALDVDLSPLLETLTQQTPDDAADRLYAQIEAVVSEMLGGETAKKSKRKGGGGGGGGGGKSVDRFARAVRAASAGATDEKFAADREAFFSRGQLGQPEDAWPGPPAQSYRMFLEFADASKLEQYSGSVLRDVPLVPERPVIGREHILHYRYPPRPGDPTCRLGAKCIMKRSDEHRGYIGRAFALPPPHKLRAKDEGLCIDDLLMSWEIEANMNANTGTMQLEPINSFTVMPGQGGYPFSQMLANKLNNIATGIQGWVPRYSGFHRAYLPMTAQQVAMAGLPSGQEYYYYAEVEPGFHDASAGPTSGAA